MENNKLSVTKNSLLSIDNQISIGNKILLGKDKKHEVIEFLINFTLKEGEDNFNAFVFISNQYPLSIEMIEKYRDHLDFNHLSLNSKLNWFDGLIDLYIENWNWKILSSNTSLPWSNNFIQKYKDYWDWEELCANEKLPWNKEFIQMNMSILLENHNYIVLSNNQGLNWTEELISLFDDGTTRAKESQILSHDQICKGIFNKNGKKVQPQNTNYDLNWKYHLKIIYGEELLNNLDEGEICWSCVCRQIRKVDNDFLVKNNSRIDWCALSENNNCLTVEIIDLFKDKLIWSILSCNENLPWSVEFIDQYNDLWNWQYLSTNNGIPWTEEIIDTFIDKWYWKSVMSLSSNPNLPISVGFINKYKDYIDFYELQSNNQGDFWTNEFIDAFESEMESWIFSGNNGFPWSIEMIKRFKDYSCYNFIHQKVIDEISPFLDDDTVTHIFDKIISRYE